MTCFVSDCDHNFQNSGCKLLRFPTILEEREKWIKAVRRSDKVPTESSRICGCHFVDGKRENGPSMFSWKLKRNLTRVKKNPKRVKKKLKNDSKRTKLNKKVDATSAESSDDEVIPIVGNFQEENAVLRAENSNLRKEIDKLKKQSFSFQYIENNEKLLSYYTGLTKESFCTVLELVCSESPLRYFLGWKVDNFEVRDQLLITLMKLRLNLDYLDLAVRFNTTEDTINNIVLTYIHTLHDILFIQKMGEISSDENNRACRMMVGYAEFDTVVPAHTNEKEKHSTNFRNILKGLIAVDPNGVITHCSQLFPASTGDKLIMKRSGITKKFKNTKILLIDECIGSDEDVLSVSDSDTYSRTFRKLRYFGILNFIPKPLFVHSNKIFQLCGALTNLVNPEWKRVEESNSYVVKEEKHDDYTKTKFEEEINFDSNALTYTTDQVYDTISCKSEDEEEIVMEFDVELEENI